MSSVVFSERFRKLSLSILLTRLDTVNSLIVRIQSCGLQLQTQRGWSLAPSCHFSLVSWFYDPHLLFIQLSSASRPTTVDSKKLEANLPRKIW